MRENIKFSEGFCKHPRTIRIRFDGEWVSMCTSCGTIVEKK